MNKPYVKKSKHETLKQSYISMFPNRRTRRQSFSANSTKLGAGTLKLIAQGLIIPKRTRNFIKKVVLTK